MMFVVVLCYCCEKDGEHRGGRPLGCEEWDLGSEESRTYSEQNRTKWGGDIAWGSLSDSGGLEHKQTNKH
jgi:hypothetical protein